MNKNALGLLGLGKRAGTVCAGEDPVRDACRRGKAVLLLAAADAGAHTVRRAQAAGPCAVLDCDKAELGAALGMKTCAIAALTDRRLAAAFLEKLESGDSDLIARLKEPVPKAMKR